ncbi:MAG: hypothetical protein WC876_07825 [Candidatus Thermoplasmatota archaeon]|jgi:hypothetical protein
MTFRFLSSSLLGLCLLIPGCLDDTGGTDSAGPVAREPTPADGQMPLLSVGDRWSTVSKGYDVVVNVTTTVAGFETHDGIASYRTEAQSRMTTDDRTVAGSSNTWFRTSDQANIEVQTTNHLEYKGHTYNGTSSVVFEPPCRSFRWPLTIGAHWEETCTAQATMADGSAGMPVASRTRYNVEAFEPVTVPAGTFDSYRIRIETDGSDSGYQWVSAQACGIVKAMAGDNHNQLSSELQSFHCAAKAI